MTYVVTYNYKLQNSRSLKLKDFQERNVKYNKDSKIQNKFDDAMLEFFAMTFSPFYLANSEYFKHLFDIVKITLQTYFSEFFFIDLFISCMSSF